jgi:OmpA-OmpF porin, OOP family
MMNKLAAVLALTALSVGSAFAADSGAYVAVDYGPATYTNATGFPNPGVLRIAGGMNLTPNFGAELGYSIFGNSSISSPGGTASIDSTSSLQFLAVGRIPVNPQFEVFGKLGIASNTYTLNANTVLIVGSATYSKTDLAFGVGAKFNITPNFGIEGQFLNYGAFDPYSVPLKASSLTIGAVFGF